MKRILATSVVSAILIVPGILGAQTLDTDRTPQEGADGEQESESLLGDSPEVDPEDVPDGASITPEEDGPQEGADGEQASESLLGDSPEVDPEDVPDGASVAPVEGPQEGAEDVQSSDAPLGEGPDVLPEGDAAASDETVTNDVTGPQAGAESGVPDNLKN